VRRIVVNTGIRRVKEEKHFREIHENVLESHFNPAIYGELGERKF
jgi:hypothetical protein